MDDTLEELQEHTSNKQIQTTYELDNTAIA